MMALRPFRAFAASPAPPTLLNPLSFSLLPKTSTLGAASLLFADVVRPLTTSPVVLRKEGSTHFDITEDALDPFKKRDDHAYTTGGAKYMPGFSFPAPRELSSIVKYALLEREAPDQIEFIWHKYHHDRLDSVATCLREGTYHGFQERARRCPNFIYPVYKGEGQFFMLMAQWQGRHCIFTYLEDYKNNPLTAEPYFAVTMFDDLLDRKGVVLVRGDFSMHITKADATKLLELMERWYLKEPQFVEDFNLRPDSFDFNKYLNACNTPGETKILQEKH